MPLRNQPAHHPWLFQQPGPGDVFAAILDRIIREDGGCGNVGVLVVHLAQEPDQAGLDRAGLDRAGLDRGLCALGRAAWPLAAIAVPGLRGLRLRLRGPLALRSESAGDLGLADPAAARRYLLEHGPGPNGFRVVVCDQAVVVAWNHLACDARGALAVLEALPTLDRTRWSEPWWHAGYRDQPGLPAGLAVRGRLASTLMPLLKPHRLVRLWKPLHQPSPRGASRPPSPANRARALSASTLALGRDATAAAQSRVRATVGRMGESAFLFAALAAALESSQPGGGDLLLPLALDLRPPGERRMLANCHGYAFVRVPAGLASQDLAAAARTIQEQQRAWLAAQGCERMGAGLGFFGFLPQVAVQAELGFGGPGVHASCFTASTGKSALSGRWFGASITGIDHAVVPTGCPGLAVLFHHDPRGLVIDVVAADRVSASIPPADLAERIRWQIVERPLATAA
ncbi:hypothetical protein LBMAG53_10120 [Planctomycetota bacterium]|nr:hypothetical protein LBMAG53_10120 [Planctomycetota bacterium]